MEKGKKYLFNGIGNSDFLESGVDMRSSNLAHVALSAYLATSAVASASDDASARSNFSPFCTPCHGESGTGDGAAGRTLKTHPANFTDCSRMSKEADDKLFRVIKEGGGSTGLS